MCSLFKHIQGNFKRYDFICSLGQVKLSLDKYLMTIYLFQGKDQLLLFPHHC